MFKSSLGKIFRSQLSETTFVNKYRHDGCETWEKLASVLVDDVIPKDAPVNVFNSDDRVALKEFIANGLFFPGGRYLYYAGRPNRFWNNCYLLRAEEDTREDWAELSKKSESCLTTGGGIGIDYSIYRGKGNLLSKTGGLSSGPIPKMYIINEIGRNVMQGGSRRSAIYASLNWQHQDVEDFLKVKDWHSIKVPGTDKVLSDLKEIDFNWPAPLDMTNISLNYDTKWLLNYYKTGDPGEVFITNVMQALRTGEPGFSFNFFEKEKETLRNAPVSEETWVLTHSGYRQIKDIKDQEETIWTGKQWAETTFKRTAELVPTIRVSISGGRSITADPSHEFLVEKYEGKGNRRYLKSIERVPAVSLKKGDILHTSLPTQSKTSFNEEFYTYGYTFGDGSFCKKYPYRAEITFCTEESKKCFLFTKGFASSFNELDARGYTRAYYKSDWFVGKTKEVYPTEDIPIEVLPSFIAGLFDADGNYSKSQNRVRLASIHYSFLEGVRRSLESLGILSGISSGGISTYGNRECFQLTIYSSYTSLFSELIPTKRLNISKHKPYRKTQIKVLSVEKDKIQDVYCCDVKVEEHSFCAEGVIISNCTEVTSADDSDVCNLGSLNLSRISNVAELAYITELATKFLIFGTLRAMLPYDKVNLVREKNRRLGLGLMGVHEWLLTRGYRYEVVPELHQWLSIYKGVSDDVSKRTADLLGISRPVANRAIAPTGTISIISGTSSGIEPVYAVAYKRRYLTNGQTWKFQFHIDHCAEGIIRERNVDPGRIESASDLAQDYERRIKFQADVQDYVDMSISSTLNLPAWGTEFNNPDKVKPIAETIAKYARRLRGLTLYPDSARGGQPLTSVPYEEAKKKIGTEFEESLEVNDACDIRGGGTCGV